MPEEKKTFRVRNVEFYHSRELAEQEENLACHWILDIVVWILDIGYLILVDIGYWILDIGWILLDVDMISLTTRGV
jgi:hypothetical protein